MKESSEVARTMDFQDHAILPLSKFMVNKLSHENANDAKSEK